MNTQYNIGDEVYTLDFEHWPPKLIKFRVDEIMIDLVDKEPFIKYSNSSNYELSYHSEHKCAKTREELRKKLRSQFEEFDNIIVNSELEEDK